jgi:hypothetical protein
MEEENKVYDIARKHLQKTDSNVNDGSMASLVWRKGNGLIVVVWAAKDLPSPEYDKDTRYWQQYNYHVAMKIVYRDGKRFIRVVDAHEGGRNRWDGPFHCGSCEYSVR